MIWKKYVIPLALIAASVLVFYLLDIGCVWKGLTGLPCPGCGMTRAWVAALHGDWVRAFLWHPLFWLIPLVLVVVLWRGVRVLPSTEWNRVFWWSLLAIYLGAYLWRMIVLFPQTPPMDWEGGAFLPRLFGLIRGMSG